MVDFTFINFEVDDAKPGSLSAIIEEARQRDVQQTKIGRNRHGKLNCSRRTSQESIEEGRRQRMDWLGARILRLLYLCDGSVAGLPADILSIGESDRRHRRFAGDLWRRLCCTTDRRILSRT